MSEIALQLINKEKEEKTGVLNLGVCGLQYLPEELCELTWLKTLIISNTYWDWDDQKDYGSEWGGGDNFLNSLPDWLSGFKDLSTLVIGGNQDRKWEITNLSVLKSMPGLKKLIAPYNGVTDLSDVGQLKQLRYLDLRSNKIDNVKALKKLEVLEVLELSENHITSINELSSLSSIRKLYLEANRLSSVDELRKIKDIEVLSVAQNPIGELAALQQLEKLLSLDLRDTGVSLLRPLETLLKKLPLFQEWRPASGVFISGCRFTDIPPEQTTSSETALNHWKEADRQGTVLVYEAKLLIVGEGSTGKTSIARKIIDKEAEMPLQTEVTHGINIHSFHTNYSGSKMRINIWDFGGQEINYATHQFFLTKRSLYLLVDNARQNHKSAHDPTFKYWLQIIKLLGDNSPLIIVQNEIGDMQKELLLSDLESPGLARVNEIMSVNPLDYRGMKELIDEIKHRTFKLMGFEMPKDWEAIRSKLEEIAATRDYITATEYLGICRVNNIPEEQRAMELSDFLHNLGVFLHYQSDVLLKDIFILRKEWATGAVYSLVNDDLIRKNKGRFNLESLKRLWYDKKYDGRINDMLALMLKFQLCHPLPDTVHEYLMPEFLPVNKPDVPYNIDCDIRVFYEYDFMPLGMMPFFIVKMHHYLPKEVEESAWRYGVRLEKLNSKGEVIAKAEVLELYAAKRISICVQGPPGEAEKFLYLLKEALFPIHARLNLKPKLLIPCVCTLCKDTDLPQTYEYDWLLARKTKFGKTAVECRADYWKSDPPDVPIDEMLTGIHPEVSPATENKAPFKAKAYLSFADEDKPLALRIKKEFAKHGVSILLKFEEIKVGQHIEEFIIEQARENRHVIFLMSEDSFYSSSLNQERKVFMANHTLNNAAIITVYANDEILESTFSFNVNTKLQQKLNDLSLEIRNRDALRFGTHDLYETQKQLQEMINNLPDVLKLLRTNFKYSFVGDEFEPTIELLAKKILATTGDS